MVKSKILVLDIEWAPAVVYTFDMWNANFSPEKIIKDGGLLCFCAHWIGSKEFMFMSEWSDGALQMAQALRGLLDTADAVITYNGDKYDLPKIRGHLMLAGVAPFAPPSSIDLIKTVKTLGFAMNRLAYIAPLLGAGEKMKHEGFQLWRSVLEGDELARKKMQKYCVKDVKVTASLYKKILPFIDNHPHMGDNKSACGACGSDHVQLRGFRRTKYFKVQRLQCQRCGSWQTGTREKV